MRTARMRACRKMNSEKGGYAYGGPPLGIDAQDGTLVVDSDEQQTVHRIKELRGEGNSLRAIAAVLAAEGHMPKRSTRGRGP